MKDCLYLMSFHVESIIESIMDQKDRQLYSIHTEISLSTVLH